MPDDSKYPARTIGAMIGLGLSCRCPRCGQGKIFVGYLKIAESCPACSLSYAGHDVGDGPVVPAMMLIGALVVGGSLYLEFAFEPPFWVHAVIWGPLVIVMVLAILPPLKGLSLALQHRYRSTEEPGQLGGT